MSVLQLVPGTSVHAKSLVILGWKKACNLRNVIGVILILICSFLKAVVLGVVLKVVKNAICNLKTSFTTPIALFWHIFLSCRTAGATSYCVCDV